MNGSLHSSTNVVDIRLKRGPTGLGFNIIGGVDQQYVMNDSGIYVSKIKEDGAAALDGRLKEGDKILAINGVVLENRTHKLAVDIFRTAGQDVELRVQKMSPLHTNGAADSHPGNESSVSSLGLLAGLVAAAAIVAVVFVRHLRKNF